ncbi:MAG: DUF3307 domain-containing protein [Chitinophagaceae bacterium]
MEITWLAKLLLSHLLADFVLQPGKWVKDRQERHFSSGYLYLHAFIAAALAWVFTGVVYWPVALSIFITHTLIDGWKSYRRDEVRYFLIDQALHLFVIFACWAVTFFNYREVRQLVLQADTDPDIWIMTTAVVFLAWPSGFLIGQLTKKWRRNLDNSEALESAGKWIGIIERILILLLVLQGEYEAIGLLIAAKSILRFNEQNRPEQKTEYLLIGTLISMGLAVITGLIVLRLTAAVSAALP